MIAEEPAGYSLAGKLLQVPRNVLDVIDLETVCTEYVFTRRTAYITGICSSVLLLPWFIGETPHSKCAYYVCTLILLVLCEVVPSEAAGLMPLLLLPVLGVSVHVQQYLAPPVLTELASTVIILCAERSSLFTRPVLWFLSACGTRHRCLLILAVGVGALCSFTLLDSSTTVLIISAILEVSTNALQDEAVQAVHQRALFEKATRRLPTYRKMQLEDALWPNRGEDSPASGALTPVSLGAMACPTPPDTSTPGSSSEEEIWSGFMYIVDKGKQPPFPLYSPPPKPLPPPARSALREPSAMRLYPKAPRLSVTSTRKMTAFIADGGIVLPGQSSPPPKPRLKGEDVLLRFSLQAIMQQGVLADVMFWDNRRYHVMYCNLLSSAALVSVVISIPALHTNKANRYFVTYFRRRFEENVVDPVAWFFLLTPVVIIPFVTLWVFLSRSTLLYYDAPHDPESIRAINGALRQQEDRLGRTRPLTYASLLLFLIWIWRRTAVFSDWQYEAGYGGHLSFDYTIVVLMLALSTSADIGSTNDEMGPRMPWGALLIYGGSVCLASVIKESSLVPWMVKRLPSAAPHRTGMQLALTLAAAVLTELLSNEDTLAILLPIAVDIAVRIPCNPLYFAIPVTVASSTSLLFPMSSFTLAYIYDRLEITPWDLFAFGLVLKCIVIIMTVLVMGTLGSIMFHWNRVPNWVGKDTSFNISVT